MLLGYALNDLPLRLCAAVNLRPQPEYPASVKDQFFDGGLEKFARFPAN